MSEYKKEVKDNNAILYRIKKDGTKIEQLRVISGKNNRTIFLSVYNKQKFIIKNSKNTLTDFVKIGNNFIADFEGNIKIFIKPHYQELHRVIMSENYNRYSLVNARYKQKLAVDNMLLDDNAIMQNMLEFIAEL